MYRILFFLALCLGVLAQIAGAQSIRAGAAKRIITPHRLLPVSGGIGPSHAVSRQQGDLYARALVLEQNGERVAIVSVDNLGWPAVLGDQSRALVHSIPPDHILIGATHTHSAPDAYGFPDETGKPSIDLKYIQWCVKQIADAINEAVGNLQPAGLKIAVAEAKGKIAYNYYAPDLYDPRCGVIQALNKEGEPIATLVNYAIHPEILGPRRGILSPDLCGPLYDRIESRGGGMAIFMNGAQGGMVTADNRLADGGEANDWAECVRIGNLLADQALSIVAQAPVQKDPKLISRSRVISLPVDNATMRLIVALSPLKYRHFENDSVKTQLNLISIGEAKILTIPGEALPNIGYFLKRKMDTPFSFLFGLTNDAFGYILTREDFDSFKRYEYISRTSLGEMTGEVYVNEVLKWLKEIQQ